MVKTFQEVLTEVKNEYRGGFPLDVRAAREVVFFLTTNRFPNNRIPADVDVRYFGELYLVAKSYLAKKEK